jgi:hypothetical protein
MKRPSSSQGNSANTNSTKKIHRGSKLISGEVYPVPPLDASDSLTRASVSSRTRASKNNPMSLRWNDTFDYIFSSQFQPENPTETQTRATTQVSYSQFLVSNLLTPANNNRNLESLSSNWLEVVDKSYNERIRLLDLIPTETPFSQTISSNQEVDKDFFPHASSIFQADELVSDFPASSIFQADELVSDFPASSVGEVSDLQLNYTIYPVVSLDDLKRDILTDPAVSLDDTMINFSGDPSVLIGNISESFTDDLSAKEDCQELSPQIKSTSSLYSTDLSLENASAREILRSKLRSRDQATFQTKISTPASAKTSSPASAVKLDRKRNLGDIKPYI